MHWGHVHLRSDGYVHLRTPGPFSIQAWPRFAQEYECSQDADLADQSASSHLADTRGKVPVVQDMQAVSFLASYRFLQKPGQEVTGEARHVTTSMPLNHLDPRQRRRSHQQPLQERRPKRLPCSGRQHPAGPAGPKEPEAGLSAGLITTSSSFAASKRSSCRHARLHMRKLAASTAQVTTRGDKSCSVPLILDCSLSL